MKLFAVGTDDPNPNNWGEWDNIRLAIAENGEQAAKVSANFGAKTVEIPMDEAMFLMEKYTPNCGED